MRRRLTALLLVLTMLLAMVPGSVLAADGQAGSPALTLCYDDYLTAAELAERLEISLTDLSGITDYDGDLLQVETLTLYPGGTSVSEPCLRAVGTGSGTMVIGGTTYTVEVQPAPLSLFLLLGQSNGEGSFGTAKDSVAARPGTAYSSYAPAGYLTASNAAQFIPRTLTGNRSRGGTTLTGENAVNAVTATGTGRSGFAGGLAWEWNRITGEKVWVINASHGGSNINTWDPEDYANNFNEAAGMLRAAAETLREEVYAGHYTLSHAGYFWLQGEKNFDTKTGEYLDAYMRMHDGLRSIAIDLPGQTRYLEFGGIFMNRYGYGYHAFFPGDTGASASDGHTVYDQTLDLAMSGPRAALYYMAMAGGECEDLYLVSDLGDEWITDQAVADSFRARYGDKETVDYTTVSGEKLLVPTTLAQVHPDIHYRQAGYNEIGLEAADNLYRSLFGGEETTPTVTLHLGGSGDVIGDTLEVTSGVTGVVPVVEPTWMSDQVALETEGSFTLQAGNILSGYGTGTLRAVYNGQTLAEVQLTAATGRDYYWDFAALQAGDRSLPADTSEGLSENDLTLLQGSVEENGVMTGAQFEMDTPVYLLASRPWSVEIRADFTVGSSMFFLSGAAISGNAGNEFIWTRMTNNGNGTYIGSYDYHGNIYNYGYYGAGNDLAGEHTLRFDNVVDENGGNMVYIYLDDGETPIASAENRYQGGANYKGKSDWIDGRDLVLRFLGTEAYGTTSGAYLLNGALDHISVRECTHTLGALESGEQQICAVCGAVLSDVPATYTAAFTWAEDYSACQAELTNTQDPTDVITRAATVTATAGSGKTDYLAEIVYNGVRYSDLKTVEFTPGSYHWDFDSLAEGDTALAASTTGDYADYRANGLTQINDGATVAAGGSLTKAQFEMDTPVQLLADRPWTVEIAGTFRTGSSLMFLSRGASAAMAGNDALWLRTTDNGNAVFAGEFDGTYYQNYGVLMGTGLTDSQPHVVRYENIPLEGLDGSGKSVVALYLDGNFLGYVSHHYRGGTDQGEDVPEWISGRDFVFRYLGATAVVADFRLSCDLDYLEIHEDPGTAESYTAAFTWAEDHSSCTVTLTASDGTQVRNIPCDILTDNDGETVTYTARAVYGGTAYEDQATVHAPRRYYWDFSSTVSGQTTLPASTDGVHAGYDENTLTMVNSGKIMDNGYMEKPRFQAENTIQLLPTNPWTVEIQGSFSVGNSVFFLSKEPLVPEYGQYMLWLRMNDGQNAPLVGRFTGSYVNYGKFGSGNILAGEHTVQFKNAVTRNADGTCSNVIKIYLDGEYYADTTTYAAGGTSDNWVDGKELLFDYLGAGGVNGNPSYFFNECTVDHIEVIESDHSYTASFTWSEDLTSATADLVSEDGGVSLYGAPCQVTPTVGDGGITYTASITHDGKTFTEEKTQDFARKYYWDFTTAPTGGKNTVVPTQTTGDYEGYDENSIKLINGGFIQDPEVNGYQMKQPRFSINRPIQLKASKPWVVEIEGSFTVGSSVFALSGKEAPNVAGETMLWLRMNDGGTAAFLGKYTDTYHNYGFLSGSNELAGAHTYRFENVIYTDLNGDRHNRVDIYIDGVLRGDTTTAYRGGVAENNDGWVDGTDLYFSYMGAAGKDAAGISYNFYYDKCTLDHILIDENSTETHDYLAQYHWSEDFSSCTVDLTCRDCGVRVEGLPAEVTSVRTTGSIIYTATLDYEGKTYTDSRTVGTTANAPSYYWDFTGLSAGAKRVEAVEENGYEKNTMTLSSGSVGAGGNLNKTVFSVEKPIQLNHRAPWVVEVSGSFTENSMVLSKFKSAYETGNESLYLRTEAGGNAIYMTEYDGNSFTNHGYLGTDELSGSHVIRYVNVLGEDENGTPTNMVQVSVDGRFLGYISEKYAGAAYLMDDPDWIDGRDFVFNYMGAGSFPVSAEMDYLKVETCTHIHSTLIEGHYICDYCGTDLGEQDVHNYLPTFNWSADHRTCTASWTCGNCGGTLTGSTRATVTSRIAAGQSIYTARVTREGIEYTDTVTEDNGYIAQSGTTSTYFSTLSEAFASSASVIRLLDGAVIDENVSVPTGKTLLIPLSATDTDGDEHGGSTSRISWSSPDRFRYARATIAPGVTVTVKGKLLVGGTTCYPDQSGQGHTSGAYGELAVDGNLVLSSGSDTIVKGLVSGEGTVTLKNGATAKVPFVVTDYSGGTNTESLYNAKSFPFRQFATVNVQCPFVIEGGSSLIGQTDLYFYSAFHHQDIDLIKTGSGLIQLPVGSTVTATYDGTKALSRNSGGINLMDYGKTTLTIDGNATAGRFYVSGYGSQSMYLNIPYTFDIIQNSGTLTMGYSYRVMPGASLTVREGATLRVTGGLQVVDAWSQPPKSSKSYPGASVLQAAGLSPAGQLTVDGTMNVTGTFAGVVQTTGTTGRIITGSGATLSGSFFDGSTGGYTNDRITYSLTARANTPKGLKALEQDKTYGAVDGSAFTRSETVTFHASTGDLTVPVSETMYGKWSPVLNLTFDPGDGEGEMAPMEILSDVATPLPAVAYSLDGHTFAGWNTDPDGAGTAYADQAEITVSEDTELFAQWTPRTYTVEFTGTAGTKTLENVPYGSDVTIPADVQQLLDENAYSYSWSLKDPVPGFTLPAFSKTASFRMPDVEGGKLTIVITGTLKTFEIRFTADPVTGQTPEALTVTYGEAFYDRLPVLEVPAGYKGYAWQKDGVSVTAEDLFLYGEDITLTAFWSKLDYTPIWTWSGDAAAPKVTLLLIPDQGAEVNVDAGDITLTKIAETPATCETAGSVTYKATYTLVDTYTDGRAFTVPATGHDWGEPTYTWSEDNATVTATVTCGNDETHVVTETVNTTYQATAPTCETAGTGTYTATFTNSLFTTQTKDITLEALGHSFGAPTWTWSGDLRTATATFTCANDETHVETVAGTVTSEVTKAATCEEAGTETFTATVTFNGKTYTSEKTAEVAALGHDWGEVSYTWSEDNATVTATRVCANDASHVETETANTTSAITTPATCEGKGVTTYTATFTNQAFQTQTKTEENVPAMGHAYGTPTYTWSEDNATVTAKAICAHDQTHVVTETVNTTATETTAATCEAPGVKTFTATFENNQFKAQSKEVTLPAIGHSWNEPTYTWSEDNTTVTATRVCANDAEHKETETVNTTSAITTPATCETDGVKTYTASFVSSSFATQTKTEPIAKLGHKWNEGEITTPAACKTDGVKTFTCQNDPTHTYTEVIPATGHRYGQPVWSWNEDHTEATATFTCGNDSCTEETEGHVVVLIATSEEGITSETTEATHLIDGQTVYTATVTMNGETFSDTATVVLTAEGHIYGEPEWSWNADFTEATATFVCKEGDDTQTVTTTEITSKELTGATCTVAGTMEYAATVTFKEATYETTTTGPIPKIAHSLTHHDPVPASCTATGLKEYWYCEACQQFFSDEGTTVVTYDALVTEKIPHSYEGPVWAWSGYEAATATFTCSACNDAQVLNAEITSEVTKEPSAAQPGLRTYTATVTFGEQVYTDTKTEDLPSTGYQVTFTNRVGDLTPATLSLSDGLYLGETTLQVSCTNACTVGYTTDGGESYTTLAATAVEGTENTYAFTFDVQSEMEIVVVLKGDVDGNGKLTSNDSSLINRHIVKTAAHKALTTYQLLIADVDGNSKITSNDSSLINRAIVKTAAHKALTW